MGPLETYADEKRLPTGFLRGLAVSELGDRVRIPYLDVNGEEVAVRFRLPPDSDKRFAWRSGDKPFLYGLWRLDRTVEQVWLVEGESDCHTLWHHGFNAVGVPGASQWREDRDARHLDGFAEVYVVVEPDAGGDALLRHLAESKLADRLMLVRLDGWKDPSEVHVDDPTLARQRLLNAASKAEPWSEHLLALERERGAEAWSQCKTLAESPDLLAEFRADLRRAGVVGEDQNAQVVFLALTSRLLDEPVSLAVKGPSSAGKSFLVDQVVRFFPDEAVFDVSTMSEHALVYVDEPLSHRTIVLAEASGLPDDRLSSYLMRSLLSEGRLVHYTVAKTDEGIVPLRIEKQGPTNLLLTTTKTRIHPENETRLLSLTVNDSPEQTAAIMRATATKRRGSVGFDRWHALARWLETGECRVAVPFAERLAELTRPVATRMRRDFTVLLGLVRSHALLHRATRDRDHEGQVVAELADYAAVLPLVLDAVSEGVEVTVPATVRETVDTVAELKAETKESVTVHQLARRLGLDHSTAWRRAKRARDVGYLVNDETRSGHAARLRVGDPMPEDQRLFPDPETLAPLHAIPGGLSGDNLPDPF